MAKRRLDGAGALRRLIAFKADRATLEALDWLTKEAEREGYMGAQSAVIRRVIQEAARAARNKGGGR